MQFINDLIHLTPGEFTLKYWWIYAALFALLIALEVHHSVWRKKHPQKSFNPWEASK